MDCGDGGAGGASIAVVDKMTEEQCIMYVCRYLQALVCDVTDVV